MSETFGGRFIATPRLLRLASNSSFTVDAHTCKIGGYLIIHTHWFFHPGLVDAIWFAAPEATCLFACDTPGAPEIVSSSPRRDGNKTAAQGTARNYRLSRCLKVNEKLEDIFSRLVHIYCCPLFYCDLLPATNTSQ